VNKGSLAGYLYIIPPVLFIALAGILAAASPITTVYEPPFLLPLLNTALLSVLPFIIAFLAVRSYARQGPFMFLVFGFGMIAFGMGSLLAGWGLVRYGQNFTVTLSNIGSLLGGLCQLGGASYLLFHPTADSLSSRRRTMLLCVMGYSAFTIFFFTVSLLTIKGYFPRFFIQGQGPTLVRQVVLTFAAIAYALSAIHLVVRYAQTGMRFLSLYSIGLFLMAIGLGIFLSQRNVGNLFGWTGRASEYVGSIYFVAAMLVGIRETQFQRTTLPTYLNELFRSHIDDQVRTRTKALEDLNKRLQEEVVHRRAAEGEALLAATNLRLAGEATGFGFYNFDFETGTVNYSPEFLKLFGLPPDTLLPRDAQFVATAIHPDDHAAFFSHMSTANDSRGLGVLDLEYRIVRADGEIRWLKIRGRTTFVGSGDELRPHQASGIVQDVTERRLAEQKVQEREEAYRSIVENSLQGVAIIQDGTITLCNEALCRMSGYSKEEVHRMTQEQILATVHPEDRPRVIEGLQAILNGGDQRPAQVNRLVSKRGELRWVEILCARTNYRGRPALQLSYMDVTEKRRAEAAYRSLIEHALYGMAILQMGRVIFANQAFADISGYSVAELLRLTPEQVSWALYEKDRESVLAHMSERLAGREAPSIQIFRFIRKDGNMRWIETQSTLVDYEGVPAVQVSYKDVTASKAAEERLAHAHSAMRNLAAHLLHAREEERRKIAQDIHDELGQTLAALKMDLHWIAKRLGEDVTSLQNKIMGTIELAAQAISTVQRVASDLRPKMLDDLGLEPALEWLGADFTRQTKIACKVTVDVPSWVIGKNAATALYRVIQEALTNIRRHSKAAHADVRLVFSDGMLNLQIEDSGIGITAEQVRASNSYGLIGLRERVEALGGSLSISGEPGSGTILQAHIPIPVEGTLA
jgi:PAS domain S-box-containing protein